MLSIWMGQACNFSASLLWWNDEWSWFIWRHPHKSWRSSYGYGDLIQCRSNLVKRWLCCQNCLFLWWCIHRPCQDGRRPTCIPNPSEVLHDCRMGGRPHRSTQLEDDPTLFIRIAVVSSSCWRRWILQQWTNLLFLSWWIPVQRLAPKNSARPFRMLACQIINTMSMTLWMK